MSFQRTLITSALPYTNGYIHLGHCAGAYLPADMYARYMRLMGEEVLYICGSDEHGAAISIAAEQEGVSPREIIDKYHADNLDAFRRFGMSFDWYSRTSLPLHKETAREFFLAMKEAGHLTERAEDQFYDPSADMFLPDRYVEGECPKCGSDKARGDQCDSCGAYYDQTELKNPVSLISGKTPEVRKTSHWYLQLGHFQTFLEEFVGQHTEWKDTVIQQSMGWLKQGLEDRCITRDLNWGVEVPLDDAEGKVIYVWFEAVLGYISATKEWAAHNNTPEAWETWWKDSTTRYLAFIGKDNLVFHALLFPAILHARNDGYILPDNVPANEFMNLEGEKFSKSRRWGIDLRDYLSEFTEPQHVDALRYVLAKNMPENKDSDFIWKDFQARVNNELGNQLGNFVRRSLHFLQKQFDGIVPEPEADEYVQSWQRIAEAVRNGTEPQPSAVEVLGPQGFELVSALASGMQRVSQHYNQFRFRDAVLESMNIAQAANKFFNDSEPWKLVKDNKEQCATVLFACVQTIKCLAVVFEPILPNSAQQLRELLHVDTLRWSDAPMPTVAPGTAITDAPILFTKVEDSTIDAQVEKLKARSAAMNLHEHEVEYDIPENVVTFDQVMDVRLKTATILEAEKVKKSKKLLKLQIDLGYEQRQIVAGIAQYYTPEDIVGKTIVVVANLKPAKLMGIESQGMLLAVNTTGGELRLVIPDGEVGAGMDVR